MRRPVVIGVTIGDINGIGPEVSLTAAWRAASRDRRMVLIGSYAILRQVARQIDQPLPPLCRSGDWTANPSPVVVWDPTPQRTLRYTPGRIVAAASRAAADWIRAAVRACLEGLLDAMTTAPICKEGLQAAGMETPGHTEMLAELTGTRRFAMMLFGGPLRVVLVTRHLPIARVPRALTTAKILEAIELTGEALPWLGKKRARIAVCGLNPHAGDGGRVGHEEIDIIEPAVRRAKARGLAVAGPVPADAVFHQALRGQYDAVVAMYHDQGLAPLKMLAFDVGVNVTIGLPLVRTSPDHGTAFDIAGKGQARSQSMLEAIQWAVRLARKKNPWK